MGDIYLLIEMQGFPFNRKIKVKKASVNVAGQRQPEKPLTAIKITNFQFSDICQKLLGSGCHLN